MSEFKPRNYNSVSPYFVVDGAQHLMDLIIEIFDAKELRRYAMPNGTIMHAELLIDDSVLMFGSSSNKFPPNQLLTHIYVKDVDTIFKKAINFGCEPIEPPKQRDGDPDRRGSFIDFAGNTWSISTQVTNE